CEQCIGTASVPDRSRHCQAANRLRRRTGEDTALDVSAAQGSGSRLISGYAGTCTPARDSVLGPRIAIVTETGILGVVLRRDGLGRATFGLCPSLCPRRCRRCYLWVPTAAKMFRH